MVESLPGFCIVVRHAEAVPARAGCSDDIRALTVQGRSAARALGKALAVKLAHVTPVIVASPMARALQTAELIAQAFRDAYVHVSAELHMDAEVEAAVRELTLHAQGIAVPVDASTRLGEPSLVHPVLAVGHEPMLSALVARLTGREVAAELARGEAVALRKGVEAWRLHA